MIRPEQGCSGRWFKPIPRLDRFGELCEHCGWEIVGWLPGQTQSKQTNVYFRAIRWADITAKMDLLLKDPKPRPMSEKALDKS